MRDVPEWIGANDNAKIPDRVMVRVFLRFDGMCQCGCKLKIRNKPWQCDHEVALINGGQHRESNLRPLLVEHHKNKTKDDVAEKAKTYKKQKAHLGLRKQSRFQTSRDGPFKQKLSGEIVRR